MAIALKGFSSMLHVLVPSSIALPVLSPSSVVILSMASSFFQPVSVRLVNCHNCCKPVPSCRIAKSLFTWPICIQLSEGTMLTLMVSNSLKLSLLVGNGQCTCPSNFSFLKYVSILSSWILMGWSFYFHCCKLSSHKNELLHKLIFILIILFS